MSAPPVPSGWVVPAAIPPPPGNAVEIGPLTLHFYGIAIAIGVLVAFTIVRRRYTAFGGDPDTADRVALWAVLAGLVGARLAFLATNIDRYIPDRPLAMLAIWEGGLAFFGGLFLGALVGILMLRRASGSLPAFADAVAPAIPVAQAFGRWGNYFNQELYGTPTDLPWALEVEPHRRVAPYQEHETFHPTFLYESLGNLVIAATLVWIGRRGWLRRGSLLFCYLMGYGVLRFGMELIRTDTLDVRILGLSRNGWVSIGAVLIGAVGLWLHERRGILPSGERPAGDARHEPAIVDDDRGDAPDGSAVADDDRPDAGER